MKVYNFEHFKYIDIYIAEVQKSFNFTPVFPKERENEINAVSNERVKREKYSAWRLLEYALFSSLGISTENAEIFKDENGKWLSPKCEFSISHSGTAVAVAISHAPVGIDVEPLGISLPESFAKKKLTDVELSLYISLNDEEKNEFLLTRWCIKEAIFKKGGGLAFCPSKISSEEKNLFEKRFSLNGEEYFCAVSGCDGYSVRRFEVLDAKTLY